MSFEVAMYLVLLGVIVVLLCTMANLLARITKLERALESGAAPAVLQPARRTDLQDPVPDEVRGVLGGHDDAVLVFLSPGCDSCDEVVDDLASWPRELRERTRMLFWGKPDGRLVAPGGVRVVPDSSDVFAALDAVSTPSYVTISAGTITERGPGLPAI